MIRTGLDQLRDIGRNTQGVRLIRLDPGDKLVAVARVVKEEKQTMLMKITKSPTRKTTTKAIITLIIIPTTSTTAILTTTLKNRKTHSAILKIGWHAQVLLRRD